jgi:hypothetical protein
MNSAASRAFVKWFADIAIDDIPLVGGKTSHRRRQECLTWGNGAHAGRQGPACATWVRRRADAFRHFIREAHLSVREIANSKIGAEKALGPSTYTTDFE